MYILAIETTGKYGSAAVIDENGKCISHSSDSEFNHLKDLTILIDMAVRDMGIDKSELTHIAASIGPGSFTGIRIGVTTARTLAQILRLPCIPINTLEALRDDSTRCTCPIINARRKQVYGAIFKGEKEILAQGPYMIDDVLNKIGELDEKVVFYGDGIDAYKDIISARLPDSIYEFADENKRYQTAERVAKHALNKAAKETVNYEKLLPDYMREAEAQTRLENGTLGKKCKK